MGLPHRSRHRPRSWSEPNSRRAVRSFRNAAVRRRVPSTSSFDRARYGHRARRRPGDCAADIRVACHSQREGVWNWASGTCRRSYVPAKSSRSSVARVAGIERPTRLCQKTESSSTHETPACHWLDPVGPPLRHSFLLALPACQLYRRIDHTVRLAKGSCAVDSRPGRSAVRQPCGAAGKRRAEARRAI